MIQAAEKEIDGIKFQVSGLDFRTERAMTVRLAKLVGPAMAALAAKGKEGAPEALKQLLMELEDEEIQYLCDKFGVVTKVAMERSDGIAWVPYTEKIFEREGAKGVMSQFKWLWFCLEHQFADFLGSGSATLSEALKSLQTKVSP